MRVRRKILTDLDQLTKLYRIHVRKNSPRHVNSPPSPNISSQEIYVQRVSPKSISPEKIKIYKISTHKNDSSLSPSRSFYTITNNKKQYNIDSFLFNKNLHNNKKSFNDTSSNYFPQNISNNEICTDNKNISCLKNSLQGPYKQTTISTVNKNNNRYISASPTTNSLFNKEKTETPNLNNDYYLNNISNLNNSYRNSIRKNLFYSDNNLNFSCENNRKSYGGALNLGKYNLKDNQHTHSKSIITDTNSKNYYKNKISKSIGLINNLRIKPVEKIQVGVPYKINPEEDNIFLDNVKINPEDLIYLDDRLNNIVVVLNNKKNIFDIEIKNECMEFYTFYFNSTLLGKFPLFFNDNNKIIIKSAFNLNLLVIIISYHLSNNSLMLMNLLNVLEKIYNLLQMNLFLFIKKIQLFYGEEYCIKNEVYFSKANIILENNNLFDVNENQIISVIKDNCYLIVDEINNTILSYYKINSNEYYYDFNYIFNNISRMEEQEIYDYFMNNLLNNNRSSIKENINKPKIKYYIYNNKPKYNFSTIDEEQQLINEKSEIILEYLRKKESPPFLKFPPNKRYTLVLDIDQTLVNVTINQHDSSRGLCKFRPGLLYFLKALKPYYEIISFTTNTKDYSDAIISQIELGKKIFDYNLYREHSVLIGKEFVKDISKIGRNLKNIIIVDDQSKNFRLNKENGILIYPFFGDDDDNVLYELKKILILFYKIGYNDLRYAIKKYEKEIKENVTLDFENGY